jgi:hypothetical protein
MKALILSLLVIAAMAGGAIRVPRVVLQRGVRTRLDLACGALDTRSRAGLLYGTPANWGYRYTYANRPSWLVPSGNYGSILSGLVPNTNFNTVLGINYSPLSGLAPALNGVQRLLLTTAGTPTISGVVGDLATLFRGVFNNSLASLRAIQGANTVLVPLLRPQQAPLGASLFYADGERIQIGPDFISAQTVAGPNGAAAGNAVIIDNNNGANVVVNGGLGSVRVDAENETYASSVAGGAGRAASSAGTAGDRSGYTLGAAGPAAAVDVILASGPVGNRPLTFNTGNFSQSSSSSSTYSTSDSSKSGSGTYTRVTIGSSNCIPGGANIISGRGLISSIYPNYLVTDAGHNIYFNSCTKRQYAPGRNAFNVGDILNWDGYRNNNLLYGRNLVCE